MDNALRKVLFYRLYYGCENKPHNGLKVITRFQFSSLHKMGLKANIKGSGGERESERKERICRQ